MSVKPGFSRFALLFRFSPSFGFGGNGQLSYELPLLSVISRSISVGETLQGQEYITVRVLSQQRLPNCHDRTSDCDTQY
jgi:hypothetical protein